MDNYRLLRSIGRGAFGNVTLYERLSDHKQVVIKQIPVYPMEESEEEVTHNEVQVISKLSHPLIIDYYGSFIENMTLNIVMEYAAGGTMSDYLKERQGKLMAQQEVLHLFTQIMLALRHIHSNNVVHRDLTTKNIFLCGKKHIIKVGDFGLSKILESRSKASSVVGTPNYLSPELCEGQEYNQKCDMWALGCVLYEMLTLNKAFDAPVQVLVRDGDMSSSFAVCAGGIIHSSWVLIAAHCIHGKPSRLIKVRAGTSYFEEGGDVHRVTYYRIYEDFLVTDSNLFYDIAVMKVDPDFNFQNPNVQPATLPTKDFSALETGSVVTLIGWGRFEKYASNPGWPISDVLRKVPNVVIPLEDCPTSAHDPHHAFCTISPDEVLRSGMNGDSGSPVYFEGILVGIHSGGSDVTSVTNDEVLNKHTNVSYFLSWIINAISEVNNEN
ncbi:serine/threonine-protein kinase Nek9 [Anabrus simplex]|uniref:serine/threonine-protein kinase Nek9 n=1 Tax=Anabrus simplex TaxID=316456 RepID=UPI0035A28504